MSTYRRHKCLATQSCGGWHLFPVIFCVGKMTWLLTHNSKLSYTTQHHKKYDAGWNGRGKSSGFVCYSWVVSIMMLLGLFNTEITWWKPTAPSRANRNLGRTHAGKGHTFETALPLVLKAPARGLASTNVQMSFAEEHKPMCLVLPQAVCRSQCGVAAMFGTLAFCPHEPNPLGSVVLLTHKNSRQSLAMEVADKSWR